ncbi:MAG: magnesium transporter [Caldilineaceae bacterium]|nr:magnesium transporter [Caldilineaceae bacterium]
MQPTVDSAPRLESTLREHLKNNNVPALQALLSAQAAPDIADLLDRLDDEERLTIFTYLPAPLAAQVLSEAGSETVRSLLAHLPPAKVGSLLDELAMDDVAHLLSDDVPQRAEQLLAYMTPEDAQEVRRLLRYPKESAGRLMTEKFVAVSPAMTAAQVIEHLRQVGRDAETLTAIYAVDENQRLQGVASLREIILAPPQQPLSEFMIQRVISVAPTDDREIVANLVSHYDFTVIPVVEDHRIIGIITVDDVLDVLVEENTEDQLRFSAVDPAEVSQPYFATNLLQVVRSRVGWLLLLFLAETTTGTVLRYFESELSRVVALSFFIPLLIGTGGNTGAQTVSTIIRGLALKEIRPRDTLRVISRELLSGLILGAAIGVIAFGRARLWGSDIQLSLVVGFTIVAIVTWANTIGSIIPLIAQRLKIDPALVSAPLITTLVDATGLVIYMLIAKALLPALQ